MDLTRIKETAKRLMINRKVHLEREKGGAYYHGERTANLVVELRKVILPNDNTVDDILTVAGWFHDCGKGIEPHGKYGALVVSEALKDMATADELKRITDMIANHPYREPGTDRYDDYTKLLQDADIIDHFGIYEIWMNIQHWAHKDGSINDMIEHYETFFPEHIKEIRERLNFEYSKQVYDERISFLEDYIQRVLVEGKGLIYRK